MEGIQFLPGGQSLVSISSDQGVKIWESQTGEIQQRLDHEMMAPRCQDLIPASDKLVYFLDRNENKVKTYSTEKQEVSLPMFFLWKKNDVKRYLFTKFLHC